MHIQEKQPRPSKKAAEEAKASTKGSSKNAATGAEASTRSAQKYVMRAS